MPSAEDRLNARTVKQDDGCWVFIGAAQPTGHVQFHGNNGKAVYVHRFAWELAFGPIPEGMCVLHRCDNPPCVNPEHLWIGTKADNNRDRASKGRSFMRDVCLKGHAYSDENTSYKPDGSRRCLTCHREQQRRYMARIRS